MIITLIVGMSVVVDGGVIMSLILEERFKNFLRQDSFSEEIDNLELPNGFEKNKKADYLLSDRKIIIELKTLKSDTSHKVVKEMNKHEGRKDYPLFYGTQGLQQVLAHLPDGKKINDRIYRNITRSIEDAVSKADKQIESTKTAFDLSDSVGVLVVLNENIEIFTPEVIVQKLSQLLCKKVANNSLEYKNIQYVWLIAESHYCELHDGEQAFISACIEGPSAAVNTWFSPVFDELQKTWAKFNNLPLVITKENKFSTMSFKSATNTQANSGKATRSDHWRLEYRKRPYLRNLSDKDVYTYGQKVLNEISPNFLKGEKRLSEEKVKKIMIEWTNFLEEANYRGLNLKK